SADPVSQDRRAHVRTRRIDRRLARCRGDASSKSAGGSVEVVRRTKIVATLGPATARPGLLDALIDVGADVVRRNFSHGTHETHAGTFREIRAASARRGRQVAVLQDLSGPKIRTGALQGGQPLDLKEGDQLRIGAGENEGGAGRIYTPYVPLIESARLGDRLLLDDGRIELKVIGAEARELV